MTATRKAENRKRIFQLAALLAAFAIVVAVGRNTAAEPSPDAEYAGVKNCKMCHSDKHEGWLGTGHARAFELLAALGKQGSAECVGCHTTGNGKKGGFQDEKSTPGLMGVQCESCHGPGKEHNGDPEKIVKTPSAAKCAECHMEMNIH